jgi:DNA-binding MarR family transcriptional regulator
MSTRRIEHDPEKSVPFLLARAGARMGDAFARALKPYGLSVTEWRVCASLRDSPGRTLSELAAHASTDLSALSRIVDRLAARGLTLRRRAVVDKRAVVVSLTVKGRRLTQEIVPLAHHYEAVALADFDHAEVRMLRSMLVRLYRNATPLP